MTGRVTFRVCIYIECVVENGMRRNSQQMRFTKCFVLGYKNGFYKTKDHSFCNIELCVCFQTMIRNGKLFIFMQFAILLACDGCNRCYLMGLQPQIFASYSFVLNAFLNLTTQLDQQDSRLSIHGRHCIFMNV